MNFSLFHPDISLLPALARLLKIDMNELFSFHEELTEKEIGQFVNELSEVSLDSFTEAFEMASRKIQEYPHCDLLIYTIATVLNGSLTLSHLNDEERMEYNTAIIEWLERTADSQDERVRNSSVFISSATNTTTFNRELLIVEKENDGKPFELHTSYEDRANYYSNLRNPWLLLMLMLVAFATVNRSVILGIVAVIFLIPVIIYQLQIMKNRHEAKMKEW